MLELKYLSMQILQKINAKVRREMTPRIIVLRRSFWHFLHALFNGFPLEPVLFLLFEKYLKDFIQSPIHNNAENYKISYKDLHLCITYCQTLMGNVYSINTSWIFQYHQYASGLVCSNQPLDPTDSLRDELSEDLRRNQPYS